MRTMRTYTAIAILLAAGIPSATAHDKAKGKGQGPNLQPSVKLTIAGFADCGEIPAKYTCVVLPNAVSLAMQWSDVPAGTASSALIFLHPRPDAAKATADMLHAKLDNPGGFLSRRPAESHERTHAFKSALHRNIPQVTQ